MTVPSTRFREDYAGNGSATSFPYAFRIFKAADLVVTKTDSGGNDTTLTLGTDYTVTGAGSYNGGAVVLSTALPTSYRLTIERVLSIKQETDLRNQGEFLAETHEDAFDRLTMIVQRLAGYLGMGQGGTLRTLLLGTGDVDGAGAFRARGNRISGLGDPVDDTDAAGKRWTQEQIAGAVNVNGSSMLGVFAITIDTIAGASGLLWPDKATVIARGRDTVGDGGGGQLRFLKGSTAPANGITVYAVTGGRLVREGWSVFGVNLYWAGAKGEAVSDDDTAAISAAFNCGAAEVVIPDDTFTAAAITITSPTLRKVSGAGVLKLKDGANTSLLNLTGTNELVFDAVNFDGNKTNQSGATQETRGNYILINLTNATTVGTQFKRCKFVDTYYGAAINNSGIRTLIFGCYFYNCGMVPKDGTCDAIFNGKSALGTRILYNHIHNCSDYGIACDTSEIVVRGNRITDCYAGIGALTRQTISSHKISGNEIIGCDKPFDYFNAVSDSNPLNLFKDILIEENTVSSLTNTGAIVSFAANNATLKLCDNVRVKGNTIYTHLNQCSAIGIAGAASNKNTDVEISGNKIYGDSTTQSARYAINVTNTDRMRVFGNTVFGTDFAVSFTGCSGDSYDNTFNVLRDAYANIDSSKVRLREVFRNVPRRAMLVVNGSTVTIDAEFENVAGNPILIYDGGTLPANTLYIDRMVLKGTNGQTVFVDGSVTHKVVFNAPPAGTAQFSSNVLQSAWNINQAPTTGSWATGQVAYQLLPATGQPKEWVCTAGGTPGSWVSVGNL